MSKALAIIPARGGSKGIPGKNLKELGGNPLIWYTITAAQQAKTLDKNVISTEDNEIAKYSKSQGVQVVRRPNNLASDTSLVIDAVKHTLEFLKSESDYEPDIVLLLNPTSPFRYANSIDQAVSKLVNSDIESVFGAVVSIRSTMLWYGIWEKEENGSIKAMYDPHKPKNRQEAGFKPYVLENGSIYAAKTHVIHKYNSLIGLTADYVLMSPTDSLDINVPQDLELAKVYLNEYYKERYGIKMEH